MVDFMDIGKPIFEKLVIFSTMILNSLNLPDILRQTLDFSNNEDVIRKRWLLVSLAKLIHWDTLDLDIVDVSTIASWNSVFPIVKQHLSQIFEAIHLVAPTLSVSRLDE